MKRSPFASLIVASSALLLAGGVVLVPLAAPDQAEPAVPRAAVPIPRGVDTTPRTVPPIADGQGDRTEILGPVFQPPAAEEDRIYEEAARAAWAFMTKHRSDETGLVAATQSYEPITTWDIASVLAGVHAAGELGLVSAEESERWLGQVLSTLATVDLYEGVTLNKSYHSKTAQMIAQGRPSDKGNGWSAVDMGRVLVWLRIIAELHPELADEARRVVERFDFDRMIEDGYLIGETLGPRGLSTYPEGKVGYEQYAAQGFRLWGHSAPNALDLHRNTEPVEVMGQSLLRDVRGGEKLTSEPFVLAGMELGWSPPFRELAWRVLAVQEARYRETGTVTMLSEDALPEPPHYFYYYSVYSDGEPFVVRAHEPVEGDGPRWVSAKAAFAWHALLPTEYTWLVVNTVQPARRPDGWASGVYEGTGESTDVRNLNTAGVILESALYRRTGRPFLPPSAAAR